MVHPDIRELCNETFVFYVKRAADRKAVMIDFGDEKIDGKNIADAVAGLEKLEFLHLKGREVKKFKMS